MHLPDSATVEDAIERLYFLAKVFVNLLVAVAWAPETLRCPGSRLN